MSTTLISSGGEASVAAAAAVVELEFVACDCCGLTEECTPAYIAIVRERHGGKWLCGLCAEAVRDELLRSGLVISTEEAMDRHATFCRSFRSAKAAAVDPSEQLIAAIKQCLRRSLEAPRAVRSTPSSPRTGVGLGARSNLVRTGSGFPDLLG
ncbi:uncharacterized protein LOC122030126 [Zingiber officinale]|uniref:DUF1677 family protein n=1 Tax=Zingiber officinale TaxID=94328 RepID=A0A8J5ECJ7_ZINOF|nr:uncharacterized protein LOC122030126 [Zingiber officinale]KAG6471802.1 hypothetical protein ZIOFF_069248 [Zingiber officinale]